MQIPSGIFCNTKGATDQPVDVDVELRQMSKCSRKFDISRSMIGGKPAKHAKMDKKATDTERVKTDKNATDTEINIKPAGENPQDLKKGTCCSVNQRGEGQKDQIN